MFSEFRVRPEHVMRFHGRGFWAKKTFERPLAKQPTLTNCHKIVKKIGSKGKFGFFCKNNRPHTPPTSPIIEHKGAFLG